jgi:hypothetical protein
LNPVHLSNLKHMSESPAHYMASLGDGEDKAAYRIGRLTHVLTIGAQRGVRWDVYDGTRRGKEWEAFKAAREGVDLFTRPDLELSQAMANAVKANARAMQILRGEFEVPVTWTHETGRVCSTRGIDCLNGPEHYTAELKTAVSSHPLRFTRDALRMGYHAQGAWVRDAAASLGHKITSHYVVAVEKKAPHVVTVFRLTERAIVEGQKLCRAWMEQLKICEESNSWPGYAQYVVDLDIADDGDGLVFDEEEAA